MENFNFYSPTRIFFGRGEENKIGLIMDDYQAKKVLIHYGSSSAVKSGLIYRIESALSRANIKFVSLPGVQPNPRDDLVKKGIALCKKEKVDFILAVGGGSVIDSAKAIAIGFYYNGDFWDFFSGRATPEKALPVGTILTVAASGSEVSPTSVITKENGLLKRVFSHELLRPTFSVLNPELTFSLSPFQTACGVVDMMSHVMERYFTNTKGVETTDRVCEAILLSLKTQAFKALKDPQDYDARANLMLAGSLAHNDLCGLGRQQDWASHALEHELSGLYDCPHGAGLAVVFPAWMQHVMSHDVARFAQLAVRVWGCELNYHDLRSTAREGIHAFKHFLQRIGMPTSFADIRARKEDIPTLVSKLQNDSPEIGHFMPLRKNDFKKIYELACVPFEPNNY